MLAEGAPAPWEVFFDGTTERNAITYQDLCNEGVNEKLDGSMRY